MTVSRAAPAPAPRCSRCKGEVLWIMEPIPGQPGSLQVPWCERCGQIANLVERIIQERLADPLPVAPPPSADPECCPNCGQRTQHRSMTDQHGNYVVTASCPQCGPVVQVSSRLTEQPESAATLRAPQRWGDWYEVGRAAPLVGGNRRRERARGLTQADVAGVVRAPKAPPRPRVDIMLPRQ
jgi:hypothetical protein